MSVLSCIFFMLALDGRKLCAENQESPDQSKHTDEEIGLNDAQCFGAKVGFVGVLGLACRDLIRSQLDAGKNENRADQGAGNGAQRIKSLRKIQPSLRSIGIT